MLQREKKFKFGRILFCRLAVDVLAVVVVVVIVVVVNVVVVIVIVVIVVVIMVASATSKLPQRKNLVEDGSQSFPGNSKSFESSPRRICGGMVVTKMEFSSRKYDNRFFRRGKF